MPRWVWVAGSVATCAVLGVVAGALGALSAALDTDPLAPYGFDTDVPDTIPERMG